MPLVGICNCELIKEYRQNLHSLDIIVNQEGKEIRTQFPSLLDEGSNRAFSFAAERISKITGGTKGCNCPK